MRVTFIIAERNIFYAAANGLSENVTSSYFPLHGFHETADYPPVIFPLDGAWTIEGFLDWR